MRLRVFGSGSKGNALAIRSGGTLLLLDCGFSCRELEKRMTACGVCPADVTAVLFTHDHDDHCKGIATFHKRHPLVPLYANGNTADAIATLTGVEDGWRIFETGNRSRSATFPSPRSPSRTMPPTRWDISSRTQPRPSSSQRTWACRPCP